MTISRLPVEPTTGPVWLVERVWVLDENRQAIEITEWNREGDEREGFVWDDGTYRALSWGQLLEYGPVCSTRAEAEAEVARLAQPDGAR